MTKTAAERSKDRYHRLREQQKVRVGFFATEQERDAYKHAADQAGMNLQQWMAAILNGAVNGTIT